MILGGYKRGRKGDNFTWEWGPELGHKSALKGCGVGLGRQRGTCCRHMEDTMKDQCTHEKASTEKTYQYDTMCMGDPWEVQVETLVGLPIGRGPV